jgi:biopolymer transport protein ExbB
MIASIAAAFQHGGFWMFPILAIQLVSIAIIIERVYALYVKRKMNQKMIADTFEESIRRGDLDTTIERARVYENSGIAKALVAGARAAKNLGGKDEIQGKMDEVLIHENGLFDRRVGFLSMLGNVATLTGLLGTITGMIKSFAAVSYANPAEKAALLAAGISEAMNATAYGLIAAIPALVAFSILNNRANRLAEDLNQSALRVFNWLSFTYEPAGFKHFRGAQYSERNGTTTQPEANA